MNGTVSVNYEVMFGDETWECWLFFTSANGRGQCDVRLTAVRPGWGGWKGGKEPPQVCWGSGPQAWAAAQARLRFSEAVWANEDQIAVIKSLWEKVGPGVRMLMEVTP